MRISFDHPEFNGARLKQIQKEKGIETKTIYRGLGIKRQTWYDLLNNKPVNVDAEVVHKLENLFGVKLYDRVRVGTKEVLTHKQIQEMRKNSKYSKELGYEDKSCM